MLAIPRGLAETYVGGPDNASLLQAGAGSDDSGVSRIAASSCERGGAGGVVASDSTTRPVDCVAAAQTLASLLLEGLTEQDLAVFARRLLPHLQKRQLDRARAHSAYTVASLAAEQRPRSRSRVCTASRRLRSRRPCSRPEGAYRRPLDCRYCDSLGDFRPSRTTGSSAARRAYSSKRSGPAERTESRIPHVPGWYPRPRLPGDGAAVGKLKGPALQDL